MISVLLRADPHQLRTLAAGKGPADCPAHHARLAELLDCRAAGCRAAEDAPFEGGGG